MKRILILLISIIPYMCQASQPKRRASDDIASKSKKIKSETKTEQEKYFLKSQKSLYPKRPIKIFKSGISKEIGYAVISIEENRVGKLNSLYINPQFRDQGLGNSLLKYAIKSIVEDFKPEKITWLACPCKQLEPTHEELLELLQFYRKVGALQADKNPNLTCEMSYPIRSANMIATLLPILEPKPVSKSEKRITLANGAEYQTNRHDPLGIIANYMGETNHIDQ